jgi:hypothetical protein
MAIGAELRALLTEEHCRFSHTSASAGVNSLKIHVFSATHHFATTDRRLIAEGQKVRAVCLERNTPSRLCLGFHWKDISPEARSDISCPSYSSIGRQRTADCSQAVWLKGNGRDCREGNCRKTVGTCLPRRGMARSI